MEAELAVDAAAPEQFPTDALPEVAVMGRSNVGKSTLVNALLGRRRLARTSSTPGKTRRIHFYRVGASRGTRAARLPPEPPRTLAPGSQGKGRAASALYLVDLPGYGYAAVSKRERASWRPLVESYLRSERECLRGAILLIDVRRELADEERDLLDWLERERVRAAVALTKADKVSSRELAQRLSTLRRQLAAGVLQAGVSAKSGRGLTHLADWIEAWTGIRLTRPDGAEFH
ncbi:MAG: GTP-binding protein [Myxococcota bacterium]